MFPFNGYTKYINNNYLIVMSVLQVRRTLTILFVDLCFPIDLAGDFYCIIHYYLLSNTHHDHHRSASILSQFQAVSNVCHVQSHYSFPHLPSFPQQPPNPNNGITKNPISAHPATWVFYRRSIPKGPFIVSNKSYIWVDKCLSHATVMIQNSYYIQ